MTKRPSGSDWRVTTRPRSKFAGEIMFRVWDDFHSSWLSVSGRSIWATFKPAEKAREKAIAAGRNPDTLKVEQVIVEIKL